MDMPATIVHSNTCNGVLRSISMHDIHDYCSGIGGDHTTYHGHDKTTQQLHKHERFCPKPSAPQTLLHMPGWYSEIKLISEPE